MTQPKQYLYTFIVHLHQNHKEKVYIIEANNDLEAFTALCERNSYQDLEMQDIAKVVMMHRKIEPRII